MYTATLERTCITIRSCDRDNTIRVDLIDCRRLTRIMNFAYVLRGLTFRMTRYEMDPTHATTILILSTYGEVLFRGYRCELILYGDYEVDY